MVKKKMFGVFLAVLLTMLFSGAGHADDLEGLFNKVEKLNLKRQGYSLGAMLTPDQKKIAESNPLEAASPDTFKFRDNNLFIVAQKSNDRVLVIYEQFENPTQEKVQDMVGDLYMSFEDPTVLAHDKVVYWAYSAEGKISTEAFDTAKQEKKKLDILATIKFISDIKIMEKSAAPAEDPVEGKAYYIISSDPILQFFKDQNS